MFSGASELFSNPIANCQSREIRGIRYDIDWPYAIFMS